MEKQDVIIIGAGPAGMTAAIYASRSGLSTLLLEESAPGGKLLKTSEISNWPGLIKEEGADLAGNMRKHATAFGAEYRYGKVVQIQDGYFKTVFLENGESLKSRAVIAASGTRERLLQIPGEKENIGRGVSYCAVCDGAFYRDAEVAVIGGGNSALEEAVYLTRFARKVTILMRREGFRAQQTIIDAAKRNPRIRILTKVIPTEILDNGEHVTGIRVKKSETGQEFLLKVQGIFPYIGSDPATGFLKGLDVLDEKGYLITGENMETKIILLYGAGDVRKKLLRQVVTAVSDGAVAAQDAFHKIKGAY